MVRLFKEFCANKDGAVTVDWVVLTAAVVALSVPIYQQIKSGSDDLAGKTKSFLDGRQPGSD